MALPRKKIPAPVPAPVDPEEFRELLLELRSRLHGDSRALRRDTLEQGGTARAPLHPADAATDSHDHEFAALMLSGKSDMIDAVDHALDRLQDGKYGACEECGQPIGAGRLRAKPWARLCIACKTKEEAGEPLGHNRT